MMNRTARGSAIFRLIIVLLAVCGVIATASPVGASSYPPGTAVLDLSDQIVPPGTDFVASVSGCIPGETVTFIFIGSDDVTVICGADGVATTTLTAPQTPGTYDVIAVLGTTGITLIDTITVAVQTTIPRTGSDGLSTSIPIGIGFVLFGAAFLAVARVRRSTPTPAAV